MKPGNIDLNHLLSQTLRHRVIIIWLSILGLLGFTLWQTLSITDPKLDEVHLNEVRREAEEEATSLELDEDLRERIQQLETDAADIPLDGRGERDPFNP